MLRSFALAVLCSAALASPLFTGCNNAPLDPAGSYAGDKTLYDVDQGVVLAYDGIDLFLAWEKTNQSTVSSSTHETAEKFRKEAPAWFRTVTVLRQAYVAEPTPENRLKLTNALGILRAALTEARSLIIAPKTACLPRHHFRWHRMTA